MQGLMWRAYDAQGFLQYSFVETVMAMHPFYVIRALGGVCFLLGSLIMVYNLWRTARGDLRDESPMVHAGAQPAAAGSAARDRKSTRLNSSHHCAHRIPS